MKQNTQSKMPSTGYPQGDTPEQAAPSPQTAEVAAQNAPQPADYGKNKRGGPNDHAIVHRPQAPAVVPNQALAQGVEGTPPVASPYPA
jgi:hypothetical protein